jgi:hypothetical protein
MSLGVPLRMRRPPATLEALGRSPLVKAGRADAPGIERVPFVPAATRSHVIIARGDQTLRGQRMRGPEGRGSPAVGKGKFFDA